MDRRRVGLYRRQGTWTGGGWVYIEDMERDQKEGGFI